MIDTEYNQTVSVSRLASGSNDRESYVDHLSCVHCSIQVLDDSFNEDLAGSMGKDRLMFCAVQDIREGDRVTFNLKDYRVVALENFNDFQRQYQHMEVLIREYID